MKPNAICSLILAGFSAVTGVTYAQDNTSIISKFDFIPGEKVIFYDDFTSESVGDFPAQWITNGSGEIVTSPKLQGRWFQITKGGYFIPEAKDDFTENFTIEFDFVPMNNVSSETMMGTTFFLLAGSLGAPGGGGEPGQAGIVISPDYDNVFWKNWSEASDQRDNGMVSYMFKSNEKYHVSFWVQKQRVRLYANEKKILDVPRGLQAGFKYNIFRIDARDEATPIISNFRIAAGFPDMRNRLLKDGKLISYGITFDVNSDKLKPESYATLKEISDVLKENPPIRILIVGHTDSDGDDASNLDLSKRRGLSVKNELVAKFGIDAARIESDGKGESAPIAENNSVVNKAKNRRVEFINLKNESGSNAGTMGAAAGSFVDARDGKNYKTTTIGTQTWMAENLAFKTTGGFAYDNNEANAKTYGYLYPWGIATKVCPAGWHLPSDKEWLTLINYLGGDSLAHIKLKEAGTAHWVDADPTVTNQSGFTALPGGIYSTYTIKPDIKFQYKGHYAYWWTATENSEPNEQLNAWFRTLGDYYKNEKMDYATKERGSSVRCIKDK